MTEIHVDFREVVTHNFLGIGVQWSAYPWWDLSEEEWSRVFRRLAFMRMPLTRIMQNAFYYWAGDDARGRPQYRFDSPYQEKLHRLLDWCETNGAQVILGEWGAPTSFDGVTLEDDDPRWASLVGDYLEELFRRRPDDSVYLFNLVNEPHGDWSTVAGRFDVWKRAMLNLSGELRRRGLAERATLVGPDADEDWLYRNLDDPELRDIVGVIDIHWYVNRAELASCDVERRCRAMRERIDELAPGKPLVLGELGVVDGKTNKDTQPNVFNFGYGVEMADAAVQLMRGGAAGFIAWYLDDAMHFLGDGEYVRREGEPLVDHAYQRRKVWGLWDSLAERMGSPEDSQLRPWFYPWSLLTRCFPAGCSVVAVRPTERGVTATAATINDDGPSHVSLVVVNHTDHPVEVSIRGAGLDGAFDLRRFDYFDLDDDNRPDAWPHSVDDDGADVFPTPTGSLDCVNFSDGFAINLPGRGVTLLTSLAIDNTGLSGAGALGEGRL